jgi:hypothetical protein
MQHIVMARFTLVPLLLCLAASWGHVAHAAAAELSATVERVTICRFDDFTGTVDIDLRVAVRNGTATPITGRFELKVVEVRLASHAQDASEGRWVFVFPTHGIPGSEGVSSAPMTTVRPGAQGVRRMSVSFPVLHAGQRQRDMAAAGETYFMVVQLDHVGLLKRTQSAPDLSVPVTLPSAMKTCPGVTIR